MKNKIVLTVSLVLLFAFIAGATVLYNKLGSDGPSGGLILDMENDQNAEGMLDHSGSGGNSLTTSPDGNVEDEESSGEEKPEASSTDAADEETSGSEGTSAEDDEPTNPAPDFTMVDLNGNEVKLSELRGKPVVLNFWASWCTYCVQEMPDFEEYYKKYGDEIHFVMLNTLMSGETEAKAKSFIEGKGYTFPVYLDKAGSASEKYGVSGIPITYFIDEVGNLVAHCPGMLNSNILQQGIDMIK